MFNRAKHAGAELSLGGREPISYMGLVSPAVRGWPFSPSKSPSLVIIVNGSSIAARTNSGVAMDTHDVR